LRNAWNCVTNGFKKGMTRLLIVESISATLTDVRHSVSPVGLRLG
jgi:hypothetical protein